VWLVEEAGFPCPNIEPTDGRSIHATSVRAESSRSGGCQHGYQSLHRGGGGEPLEGSHAAAN